MVAKSARFLAPIALAAVAVGVYLIVHASPLVQNRSTTARSAAVIKDGRERHRHPAGARYYTVKSGDTLSGIAAKTGVPLNRLTHLNPSVSAPPYNLQTGQRLRLRR